MGPFRDPPDGKREAGKADRAQPRSALPPTDAPSKAIVLPSGISTVGGSETELATMPASQRSTFLYRIALVSIPLSVFIIGLIGGIYAVVESVKEWKSAKRDGAEATRRKSVDAVTAGSVAVVIGIVVVAVGVARGDY